MGLEDVFEKAIDNRRHYKYHTYEIEYDRDEEKVKLYHYGTLILEYEIPKDVPTEVNICSKSDSDAVSKCLRVVGWDIICGVPIRRYGSNDYTIVIDGKQKHARFARGINRKGILITKKPLRAYKIGTRHRKVWLCNDGTWYTPDFSKKGKYEEISIEKIKDIIIDALWE